MIRLAPQDLDEEYFTEHYRIDMHTFQWLCNILGDDEGISRKRGGKRALPATLLVSTALLFFTSGSFQNMLGELSSISQTSQSRALCTVSDALACLANGFINYANCGTPANIKAAFARIAAMTGTLGAIGCTHGTIRAPSEGEYAYTPARYEE